MRSLALDIMQALAAARNYWMQSTPEPTRKSALPTPTPEISELVAWLNGPDSSRDVQPN
jgi:hypothetical protein